MTRKDYSFEATRSVWSSGGFRGYKNDHALAVKIRRKTHRDKILKALAEYYGS